MKKPLLLIPFILTACTSYQYVPNSQTVPLFTTEKTLNLNCMGNGHSFYGSGAYSLTNHLAVSVSGNSYQKSITSNPWFASDSCEYYNSKNIDFDGALGYFNHYDIISYEVYSGFGYGTSNFKHKYYEYTNGLSSGSNDSIYYKANKFKWFIQPDLGIKLSNSLEVILSSRFSVDTYRTHNLAYNKLKTNQEYNFFNSNNERTIFLIEPAITLRTTFDYLNFQIQAIRLVYISTSKLYYNNVCLNFGICMNFH